MNSNKNWKPTLYQNEDNFKKNVESVVIIINAGSETFLMRARLKCTHCQRRFVLYRYELRGLFVVYIV